MKMLSLIKHSKWGWWERRDGVGAEGIYGLIARKSTWRKPLIDMEAQRIPEIDKYAELDETQ